jgi:hypothetical protein
MKAFLLLTVLASPLVAQATPQRGIPVHQDTTGRAEPQTRIPLRKEDVAATVPGPERIVIHDTVIVYRTDSLGIFQSAISSTMPETPVPAACGGRFLPIPIPIPLSRGHGGGSSSAVIPVNATPEPGSLTLLGTGLLGLTMYVRRNRK